MSGWDKTVKQIVREAHMAGCLDVLRAVLDQFDMESDHECLARSWCVRMYQDPQAFDRFINDSQSLREGAK